MKNPEISQFNLNSGIVTKHHKALYCNQTWHKIEVMNACKLDRDSVLRTIMNAVHPLDFIPVGYELKNGVVSFLLKNCGVAIEKLCKQNLVVANPYDPLKPFQLKIILNFAKATDLKINIQSNITNILHKRFNAETGVLNLDAFYKDPELLEFCMLSQPKLMFYVLHLCRNFAIKTLKLTNNEIEVLKPLEALYNLKSLSCLDLRNNKIKIIDSASLKELPVTEVWLDGNPICDDYNEFTYAKAMKEIFVGLEKLDGINVNTKGFLPFRRNFLCDPVGFDLVNQFIEHFFTLYDSPNRNILDGLYHKEALFSLTASYLALQTTSFTAQLGVYKKVSRNIKMMSDFSKNEEYLFKGSYAVLRLFSLLPRTEHDPYTFMVDLLSYTDKTAVIVVSGVFREISETIQSEVRLLGFNRIFVLLAGQNNEYSIINEQMHVSNATTAQTARAFKHTKAQKLAVKIPVPQNNKEQQQMAQALQSLTGLTAEWATKCLEECQYDMKRTLNFFLEMFKVEKIPPEAFVSVPPTENFTGLGEIKEMGSNGRQQDTNSDINKNLIDLGDKRKELRYQLGEIKKAKNENAHETGTNNADVALSFPALHDKVVSFPLIVEDYSPFCYYNVFTKEGFEFDNIWHRVEHLTNLRQEFYEFVQKWEIDGLYPSENEAFTKRIERAEAAMAIVKKYSFHSVAYELMLACFFVGRPAIDVGRYLLKLMKEYIISHQQRSISLFTYNILDAECELSSGNPDIGLRIYNNIRKTAPYHVTPILVYLRYLISKPDENGDKIKLFVKTELANVNIDRKKLIQKIKEYERAYNIDILNNV